MVVVVVVVVVVEVVDVVVLVVVLVVVGLSDVVFVGRRVVVDVVVDVVVGVSVVVVVEGVVDVVVKGVLETSLQYARGFASTVTSAGGTWMMKGVLATVAVLVTTEGSVGLDDGVVIVELDDEDLDGVDEVVDRSRRGVMVVVVVVER